MRRAEVAQVGVLEVRRIERRKDVQTRFRPLLKLRHRTGTPAIAYSIFRDAAQASISGKAESRHRAESFRLQLPLTCSGRSITRIEFRVADELTGHRSITAAS